MHPIPASATCWRNITCIISPFTYANWTMESIICFGYYEYTGKDYKADMEKLGAEPRNQKWLSVSGPMQIPLTGEKSWAMMQELYHNP